MRRLMAVLSLTGALGGLAVIFDAATGRISRVVGG